MIIKVCGMREAQNIADVAALGVDIIGLIFYPKSKRYVSQIPTMAGIIPDKASDIGANLSDKKFPALCGVFVDDMPQTILTRVINYHLSYIQLHGNESPIMIDNLKRTLIPDFVPEIKI
ncbi:MAG: phosphoribosylanthranilate isomerase, partial [Bacteroidaceae bacterium]|nr:phosphoribosylanthranilate isomerase [Bacteroidaceae bacterium]